MGKGDKGRGARFMGKRWDGEKEERREGALDSARGRK
jgi:hypothetical protein